MDQYATEATVIHIINYQVPVHSQKRKFINYQVPVCSQKKEIFKFFHFVLFKSVPRTDIPRI